MSRRYVLGVGMIFVSVLASRQAMADRDFGALLESVMLVVLGQRMLGCSSLQAIQLLAVAWRLEAARTVMAAAS